MARALTWIAILLAVGAAVWFLLPEDGQRGGPDGLGASQEPGATHDRKGGPVLAARDAPRAAADTTPTGSYVVRGVLQGPKDAPLAGVQVNLVRQGPTWRSRRHDPERRGLAARLERLRRYLLRPLAKRDVAAARARTDEQGRFVARGLAAGSYRVQARPPAPWVASYAQVDLDEANAQGKATLVLVRGTPLRGRVLDTTDAPQAATLRAYWNDRVQGTYRGWYGEILTTDPADGRFAMEAVPAGTLYFTVELPGGLRVTKLKVETPHEGEVVLRVPAGAATVGGTVTDATGAPVAEAQVLLSVHGPGAPPGKAPAFRARAVSDAAGRYRIEHAPAGPVSQVQALADGFLPYDLLPGKHGAAALTVPAQGDLTVDVHLARGGTVTGVVREEGTQTPLADVAVTLHPTGRAAGSADGGGRARTDAQGRYRVENLPVGRYVALPQRDGWYLPEMAPGRARPQMDYRMRGRLAPPALTVVVTAEEGTTQRDLVLARGFPVHGRVVDAHGGPVGGAEVHAKGYGLQQLGWQWGVQAEAAGPLATSRADGSFEVQGLPPGNAWILYARKENLVGRYGSPFALGPDRKPGEVKLVMASGGVLRGHVQGLEAEARSDVHVNVWGPTQELGHGLGNTRVDEQGRFEIRGVPPGDWTLNAWAGGRSATNVQVKALAEGEVREGLVLDFGSACEVSGVVVTPDGDPVPNLQVAARPTGGGGWTTSQTRSDGSFTVRVQQEGSVQILAWTRVSRRQVALGKPVEAPARDLRLTWREPPTVHLAGTVLAPDGEPVALCTVEVVTTGRSGYVGGPNDGAGVAEAIHGSFEVQAEGEGPWTLKVSRACDARGTPLNVQEARTTVKEASTSIVIKLQGGHEVSGRVLDPKDQGVPGVRVSSGNSRATTGADGSFTLRGLAGGRVGLSLQPPPPWVKPATVLTEAGADDVVVTLAAGLVVAGHVLGPDGKPAAQGYVSATWKATGDAPAGNTSAQLGAGGAFRVQGIPSGVRVRLQVQTWSASGGQRTAPKIVEDVEPGTEDLEIRLGLGLAIEGELLDADGRPALDCYVYARSVEKGLQSGYVRPDAKGHFRLTGLESVPYDVKVWRQGQGQGAVPQAVRVTPPATGVRLRLPVTTSLEGRLEGVAGDGKAWVVVLYRPDGTTAGSVRPDAEGRFHLDGVAAGPGLVVGARNPKDDRYARSAPVDPATGPVVLHLVKGQSIRGVVAGAENVEGVRLTVQATGDGWSASGTVAEDGSFVLRGLPAGTYKLKAWAWNPATKLYLKAEQEGVQAGATGVRLVVKP